MKNLHATRVVATAAVVALLLAFAVPAAAAPATGISLDTPWSPAGFVQWAVSLWTGWFGSGSEGEVAGGSGMGNVYDEEAGTLEPDGVFAKAISAGTTFERTGDGSL